MKDMQSFINYSAEMNTILAEATEGHNFQNAIAKIIFDEMTPEQRGKIKIKVAPPSSTLPDIAFHHMDHPGDPLIIECKMGNSQSGGITWVSDGSNWNFSTRSARAKRMCEVDDPTMCAAVMEMVKTPLVINRISKIQSELGKWFPELSTKNIPFQACKEFWPTLLDKYTNKDEGGKWQIPLMNTYWKTLNYLMKSDHFLYIRGSGMFRVGGCKMPIWFKPTNDFLSKMPIISEITAAPKGNLELRMKQGGMKQRKLQKNRELRIHSITKPTESMYVHVKELGTLGKSGNYQAPIGLIGDKGPCTYIVNTSEAGSIGQIKTIHSIIENTVGNDMVWIVKCDLSHRVGTITFETNLRIINMAVNSSVNFEKNADDTKKFASFL